MQALPPSHTLTEIVYQASLVEQESCGQCCDGYHVCGASDTCRPTPSRDGSFCVPNNATSRNYCGVSVLMNQEVSCESCDEPSPAAVLYESLFDEPESASSRRRLLTTSFAAAPSSGGFCYNSNHCKVCYNRLRWRLRHRLPAACGSSIFQFACVNMCVTNADLRDLQVRQMFQEAKLL